MAIRGERLAGLRDESFGDKDEMQCERPHGLHAYGRRVVGDLSEGRSGGREKAVEGEAQSSGHGRGKYISSSLTGAQRLTLFLGAICFHHLLSAEEMKALEEPYVAHPILGLS
jgi:hypothetical protein